jgi:glycosyltransferase involved in cell wall biosynthesis
VTDAFGGRGGIAQFNRDLLSTLCSHPDIPQVTALPRVIADKSPLLPSGLIFETGAARGKAAYAYHFGKVLAQRERFAAVLCGHLHLLPFAALAARRNRAPLILIIHGIEAWQRPRTPGLDFSLRAVDKFVSVSRLTKQRFLTWARLDEGHGYVIPNCVDTSRFRPGPKPDYLLKRYALNGCAVLMTVARLSSPDRYKGIDEVLEVLPLLVQEKPNLKYLIAGDGHDRRRLECKAVALGVPQNVIFAGYVSEEEKADHYRLADAFVMPGRGEGFGIVYLEAMACGIPVVASKADASREAVLEGKLGQIVDPDDLHEIRVAIRNAILQPREVPPGLEHFSVERFSQRWHAVVDHTLASKRGEPPNGAIEEESLELNVVGKARRK